MFEVSGEQAAHDIIRIKECLSAWRVSQGSDSVRARQHGQREKQSAESMLTALADMRSKERVQLTTGNQPLRAVTFDKGPYDFFRLSHRTLKPESRLPIEEVRRSINPDHHTPEFFIGRIVLIEVGVVAQTLQEGGYLEVVSAGIANEGLRQTLGLRI